MDVIEEMYRGNIREETITPGTKRYKELVKKSGHYSELLDEQLSLEQHQVLDQYLDNQAAMIDLEHLEFFRQGIIIGVKMMLEVL